MDKCFWVPADGVCRRFERADWSLIEEPEVCELCAFYDDSDGFCRRAELEEEYYRREPEEFDFMF